MENTETVLIRPQAFLIEGCLEENGFYGDFCKHNYPEITSVGKFYTEVSELIDKEGMQISAELYQWIKCLSRQLGLIKESEIDSLALIVQVIKSAIAYRNESFVIENAIELKNHVDHLKSLKDTIKILKPYKEKNITEYIPITIKSKKFEITKELANRLISEIRKYKNEQHAKYQSYIRWNDKKWDTVYANEKNIHTLNIRYQKQLIKCLLKFIDHLEPVIDYAKDELVQIPPGKINKLIARVFQLSGLRPRFTPEEEHSLCNESSKRKDRLFETQLEQNISSLKNTVMKELELKAKKIDKA